VQIKAMGKKRNDFLKINELASATNLPLPIKIICAMKMQKN
jgi:hypothetical protein